jgi:hypothetical protein
MTISMSDERVGLEHKNEETKQPTKLWIMGDILMLSEAGCKGDQICGVGARERSCRAVLPSYLQCSTVDGDNRRVNISSSGRLEGGFFLLEGGPACEESS